jgi:hypothetical protein
LCPHWAPCFRYSSFFFLAGTISGCTHLPRRLHLLSRYADISGEWRGYWAKPFHTPVLLPQYCYGTITLIILNNPRLVNPCRTIKPQAYMPDNRTDHPCADFDLYWVRSPSPSDFIRSFERFHHEWKQFWKVFSEMPCHYIVWCFQMIRN